MSCFKMGKQLTHFSDFAQVWWPGVADSTCKKWVLYIMSTISSKSTPQFFLYFPGKQMDVRALTIIDNKKLHFLFAFEIPEMMKF